MRCAMKKESDDIMGSLIRILDECERGRNGKVAALQIAVRGQCRSLMQYPNQLPSSSRTDDDGDHHGRGTAALQPILDCLLQHTGACCYHLRCVNRAAREFDEFSSERVFIVDGEMPPSTGSRSPYAMGCQFAWQSLFRLTSGGCSTKSRSVDEYPDRWTESESNPSSVHKLLVEIRRSEMSCLSPSG
jgi:hypothetical protein